MSDKPPLERRLSGQAPPKLDIPPPSVQRKGSNVKIRDLKPFGSNPDDSASPYSYSASPQPDRSPQPPGKIISKSPQVGNSKSRVPHETGGSSLAPPPAKATISDNSVDNKTAEVPTITRVDFSLQGLVSLKKLMKSTSKLQECNPNAFMLQQLLSVEECEYYMGEAERMGFVQREPSARNVGTAFCRSKEFATLLWRRVGPQIRSRDIIDMRPRCIANHGTWVPHSLFDVVTFNRIAMPIPTDATLPLILEIPDIDLKDIITIGDNNMQAVYTLDIFLNDPQTKYKVVLSPTFIRAPTSDAEKAAAKALVSSCIDTAPDAGAGLFHTQDLTAGPSRCGVTTSMGSGILRVPSFNHAGGKEPDYLYVLRVYVLFQRTDTRVRLEVAHDSYALDNLAAHSRLDKSQQWESQNASLLASLLDSGAANWGDTEAEMLGDEYDNVAGDVSSDDESDGGSVSGSPTKQMASLGLTGSKSDGHIPRSNSRPGSPSARAESPIHDLQVHTKDKSRSRVQASGSRGGSQTSSTQDLPKLYTTADISSDSYALDPLAAFVSSKKS